FPLVDGMLLVPLRVGLEHLLVQDYTVTLHGTYQGVNNAPLLLASAVLPRHTHVLQVLMLREDGTQVNLEQAVAHVGLDNDVADFIATDNLDQLLAVFLSEATHDTAYIQGVNVRPHGTASGVANLVAPTTGRVNGHDAVFRQLHPVALHIRHWAVHHGTSHRELRW